MPGIAHISLFHDEFFISSTLGNSNAQLLYSYLVGCSEAIREDRRMKCFTYKEVSKNIEVISQDPGLSKKADSSNHLSDFCRVNSTNSFTYVSKTLHGFVMGPHSFSDNTPSESGQQVQGTSSMQNFAPTIYMTDDEGVQKAYRLVVYIGHKTMLALLIENDFSLEYNFLLKLDAHLAKHAPIISQLIDIAVNKVLQPDDPCKFFYYNEGNLAVKVSNLLSRETFDYGLKLQLDQMHQAFLEEPELMEQQ